MSVWPHGYQLPLFKYIHRCIFYWISKFTYSMWLWVHFKAGQTSDENSLDGLNSANPYSCTAPLRNNFDHEMSPLSSMEWHWGSSPKLNHLQLHGDRSWCCSCDLWGNCLNSPQAKAKQDQVQLQCWDRKGWDFPLEQKLLSSHETDLLKEQEVLLVSWHPRAVLLLLLPIFSKTHGNSSTACSKACNAQCNNTLKAFYDNCRSQNVCPCSYPRASLYWLLYLLFPPWMN